MVPISPRSTLTNWSIGVRWQVCRRVRGRENAKEGKDLVAEIRPVSEAMDEALTRLQAGEVVAIPTETVYGLAGDATNGEAVARIFEAKGRPRFNPLIAHVDSMDMAESSRVSTRFRFASRRHSGQDR